MSLSESNVGSLGGYNPRHQVVIGIKMHKKYKVVNVIQISDANEMINKNVKRK